MNNIRLSYRTDHVSCYIDAASFCYHSANTWTTCGNKLPTRCNRGFWCRIHLRFRWMGGLQAKSMTSQRAEFKMADMRYYDNVMITTRWLLIIHIQQQNTVINWTCYRCILHLQQYSHRLNLFFLLQILLLAQHVAGITMPIIRSSRVLYSGCCLW